MKALTVGLHKQTHSSLQYHAEKIASLLEAPSIVPSMTDSEVRYEIGKQRVVEHVQEQSQNPSSALFDESFVVGLCEQFRAPPMILDTPLSTIMYWAGIAHALEVVVRYYHDELGG